jgi:hypothetical protein
MPVFAKRSAAVAAGDTFGRTGAGSFGFRRGMYASSSGSLRGETFTRGALVSLVGGIFDRQ